MYINVNSYLNIIKYSLFSNIIHNKILKFIKFIFEDKVSHNYLTNLNINFYNNILFLHMTYPQLPHNYPV